MDFKRLSASGFPPLIISQPMNLLHMIIFVFEVRDWAISKTNIFFLK